jgi:uncharacterized protein (DUF1800 family)
MLKPATNTWTFSEAAHLLRRAGFGGAPDQIRALYVMGRANAVDFLVKAAAPPSKVPAWAEEKQARENIQVRYLAQQLLREEVKNLPPAEAAEVRRKNQNALGQESFQRLREAQNWWFEEMLRTRAPLREKMTLFWHDHFATSTQKVREPEAIMFQNMCFRKYALGSFKELAHEIVQDPAMMLYLDAQNSNKRKPNENFARELMELFTLGVGHYTETDIKEAARAMTGYQIDRETGEVIHRMRQWDPGQKTLFGKTGNFSADDVVDIIFEQEQCARYLPWKLWEYFVADDPSKVLVDELGKRFRAYDFNVAPLLRDIFMSQEFYADEVVRNQIKCPIQYMVQLCKELELTEIPRSNLLDWMLQTGQELFAPPNVAGWDWGKAWINTNTLLFRYRIAGFITTGDNAGDGVEGREKSMMQPPQPLNQRQKRLLATQRAEQMKWLGPDYEEITPRNLREDPAALVDLLIQRFFQTELTPKQRGIFIEYAESKLGVVFTNHEVAELCYLMLSTPYYQLC